MVNMLTCYLQLKVKSKTRLGNNFHQCGLCNESYYGECVWHLNVRIGEHIGISPHTEKQVKPTLAPFTYLTGHSNKTFVRILFVFSSSYVILTEWTFYYLVMCTFMSTTVPVNVTVQFTFFLIIKLNITIVTSCNLIIAILVT